MSHHVIDIEAISTLSGEVLTTQEKCSDGVEKINVFILISVSFVCPFFHALDDNLCFH
jgi:ABC-type uncharacterized transport system permease subunit